MKIALAAPLLAALLLYSAGVPMAIADEIPDTNPLSGDEKAIKEGKSWFRVVAGDARGLLQVVFVQKQSFLNSDYIRQKALIFSLFEERRATGF